MRGQVVAIGPQTTAGRQFDVAVIELFGEGWLDDGWARSVDMMMGRMQVKGPSDFPSQLFTTTPAEARAAREAKRGGKKKKPATP